MANAFRANCIISRLVEEARLLIGAGVVSVESTFARGFPLGSRAYHGEMATGREQ